MKKMIKDYIVLLIGLVISISIFYMFQTLALNKEFTMNNSIIGSIVFVFQIGSVLVAFITFFYIFYANSFLLSLRQKELGMYLVLGAKKSKISQLLFFETFIMGMISLVLGSVFGAILSNFVSKFLTKQLEISAEGYQAFYGPAFKITFIFFSVLFLLTSVVNVIRIALKTELDLIRTEEQTERIRMKGPATILLLLCSLLGLGVGYYFVLFVGIKGAGAIMLPLFTITIGTYLIFISFLPMIVNRLKKTRYLNEKKLNAFTFAQLQFRVSSLAKILGTVTMLIGLGVGAMAGGMSLQKNVILTAERMSGYDITIHDPEAEDYKAMEKMKIVDKKQYKYKVNNEAVYYLKEELLENPPLLFGKKETTHITEQLPSSSYRMFKGEEVDPSSSTLPLNWDKSMDSDFRSNISVYNRKPVYIVDEKRYEAIQGNEHTFFIAKVDNILRYKTELKEMDDRQIEKIAATINKPKEDVYLPTNYSDYESMRAFSKVTSFMGFFLGLAFLAMMASCLMFKILSGATKDIGRYEMLRKIGVRKELLIKSMYKELGIAFLFPAILGLIHVLVGMNVFTFVKFFVNPYVNIGLPICIFLIIYVVYYLITIQLYKGIVLPKKK
ncbi:hypothetical protein IGM_05363 [Bacillus cereus HuB4-4]|uniref:ABC3 transporter permease C-terminal domain-containing protein n=2 Tax=Bacillus cereus TaxID=1396 RepID=A0A9W5QQ64_BACCE|nr:hypothetical protein IGM_05363 [Bacillus cereus HuB4-4]